jgi:hypothetical protein
MMNGRRGSLWSKLLVAVVALVLSLLAVELVLAWRLPFAQISWPGAFDPRVGRIFAPHGEVQYTNYADFALTQRANALGFLDREPPGEKAPGMFRVLVLGDSFVEAVQVPIEQKIHVVLERLLAERHPDRRFETSAFGHSAAGTAAEYAYYETYGRALRPDLVVVVFVQNDFADDSPLLESITYGWWPDHPPWPLFDIEAGGGFRRLTVEPDTTLRTIDVAPPPDPTFGWRGRLRWSRLAQMAFNAADLRWQWTSRNQMAIESALLARLRNDARYQPKLEGWRYPDDLDHNQMFFAREMPPVFEEAVALTDHVFGLFAEARARDGFELLILATPPCSATPARRPDRRELVDKGLLKRIERIAARHDMPVVDLATAFAERGNPEDAHWRHDSHWNAVGHRWAAEVVADFVDAHAERLLGTR